MQANNVVIKTARIEVQSRLFVLEEENDLSCTIRHQTLLNLRRIPFSNVKENKICIIQFLNAFASQPLDRPDQHFSCAAYTFGGAFIEKAEQMHVSWCSDFEDLNGYRVRVRRVVLGRYSSWTGSPCKWDLDMYRGTLSIRMVSWR